MLYLFKISGGWGSWTGASEALDVLDEFLCLYGWIVHEFIKSFGVEFG